MTGRYYHPIETYRTEDAETLLVTMGSFGETASVAVDQMRAEGRSVGLVKIRLWRPFPFDDFKKAVQGQRTWWSLIERFPREVPKGLWGPK